ncbi:MAG: hypothetical protein ACK5JH_14875 [Anaerocolumna sp.]
MTVTGSYSGIVLSIEDIRLDSRDTFGCNKLFTIQDRDNNIINFIVTPSTYFIDHKMANEGDYVTGFYDSNAPTPLIFPPQFRALVMAVNMDDENVAVDYFNRQLISSDGMLKLNLGPSTLITLENGQRFYQNPGNHLLYVVYGPSTRSIPAQTTPRKIIVHCQRMS